ncbi:hypothetical protein HZA99_05135 [Candidatus Woesearchaeota archaeon]|nr:hypothetical protein [Candidatus Woesearchaeota archaeon]
MAKPELVDYIKKQLSNGHDTATIREHLLKHGYTEALADEGLIAAHAPPLSKKAKMKYFPFSGKALAYVVVVLAVLGIGFGLFSFYQGSSDLAGAAHEAPMPEELQPQQNTETAPSSTREEPAPPEEISTSTETTTPETTVSEETTAGCTSNSACTSGSVCYQHTCEIDTDHDGASDVQEQEKGTDIHKQDTDADSYFDADEFSAGTDALDSTSPGYTSCKINTDCTSEQACSSSGICVTCKDSDALNYKKQGTIRGVQYIGTNIVLSTDSCDSSGKLTEYYCSQGYSLSKNVDCETEYGTGYSCSSGKCAKG